MDKINFVENKKVNWEVVNSLLQLSEKANQWSNFGPVSLMLEEEVERLLGLDKGLKVVMCCSGTQALYALVNLYNHSYGRQLKWVVSSFGFPCCVQGALQDAIVIDCNSDGLLDMSLLDGISFDGIVATNIFGLHHNLNDYKEYCHRRGKILVIDAAMAFGVDHGPREAISFHHTKPWGMGEGGCVIVERKFEREVRSIINFGLLPDACIGRAGMNGKISDISSAFILSRLYEIKLFEARYNAQYSRVCDMATSLGIKLLGTNACKIPTQVPLLFDKEVAIDNDYIVLRKYYKPLDSSVQANALYAKIVNFPCHPGVEHLNSDMISELLNGFKILSQQ